MHGSVDHILFNMFALWLFGTSLENYWGGKRFLIYYLATGLGAGLIHLGVLEIQFLSACREIMYLEQIQMVREDGLELLMHGRNYVDTNLGKLNVVMNVPTVGASGAVFGLLLAFGMMFPNAYILLPIPAKYFVVVYGLSELISGLLNRPGDNVAHFAHLGGMIIGYFLIRFWQKNQFRIR
jgi:membrane associated rhomboid family serine protease